MNAEKPSVYRFMQKAEIDSAIPNLNPNQWKMAGNLKSNAQNFSLCIIRHNKTGNTAVIDLFILMF